MGKKLFLYDFDGTLTTKDSLWEFLKYCFTKKEIQRAKKKALPYFFLYSAKRKRWKIKEKIMQELLREQPAETIKQKGLDFAEVIPNFLNKEMYNQFLQHKNEGDVYIVSASFEIWLGTFAEKEGVGLICSQWDFENNCMNTPNCNYEEKVRRIKERVNMANYNYIRAFGDSSGDDAMLNLKK